METTVNGGKTGAKKKLSGGKKKKQTEEVQSAAIKSAIEYPGRSLHRVTTTAFGDLWGALRRNEILVACITGLSCSEEKMICINIALNNDNEELRDLKRKGFKEITVDWRACQSSWRDNTELANNAKRRDESSVTLITTLPELISFKQFSKMLRTPRSTN